MDLWFASALLCDFCLATQSKEEEQGAQPRPVLFEGFFSGHLEASFLAGTIAGILLAYNAALARSGSVSTYLFASFILLQGPAIAERSLRKCLGAIMYMLFALFIWTTIIGVLISGRESLPITVWGACNPFIMVGGGPHGWRAQALFVFALYWLWVGMGIIVFQKNLSNDGVYKRFFAAMISIAVGILLALVLFRISWCAKVSGTFARPLYTESEFIFSLLVYGLLFAIVPCAIQYCYIRLLRIKLWDSRSLQEME
jgi:hypothetical protein